MEKDRMIVALLIVIIVALLVCIFAVNSNFGKADSKLEILGNDTFNEGDNLQVRLTDANGTALANQTVNVTVADANKTCDYHSVVTNDDGVGSLKLEKSAGEYDVTFSYSGNDSYNACNATKRITVEKEAVDAQVNTLSNDPGAFYSAQVGRVIYTGEVLNGPGGLYRHLGYNQWEPVK